MLFKLNKKVPFSDIVNFFAHLDDATVYNYGRWALEQHKKRGMELVSGIVNDPLETGVLVIEDKDIVVGYGHLNTFEKYSRRYQGSVGLVIHQNYQREGRGTALLHHLLVMARLRGLKKVWAHIHEDNIGSLQLFTKMGFEKEGVFKDDEWYNDKKPISVISVATFLEEGGEIEMGKVIVRKEKISLRDPDQFIFSSDWAKEIFLDVDLVKPGYPVDALINSIKENGFNPAFPDVSYHVEAQRHFMGGCGFRRAANGKLAVSSGLHRLACARKIMDEVEVYIAQEVEDSEYDLNRFSEIVTYMNNNKGKNGFRDLFQSFHFPGGLSWEARDNSEGVFKNFKVPPNLWVGRSVFDIGCGTGFYAIKSALLGAEPIAGFDLNGENIKIANMIANAYNLRNHNFSQCEFWDYPFNQTYDIVFCNQAIYHFTTRHRSKCSGSIDDMLDRVSRITGRVLLMYTYVNQSPQNEDGGYYPTSQRLKEDLLKRGFSKVFIYNKEGYMRRFVIAIKKWENLISPIVAWDSCTLDQDEDCY